MIDMENKMKIGSLFDGSGGFPLAGTICGITPVWASEIEPYPISVTKARFPEMKHLGSVTQINGAEIEPVDVITFGSPCQDLSVAGKQKGIHEGERSNLFFEAIRIIHEMREATDHRYPRYAVWENVPGAFSSNKGHDFRAVLQAFCDEADQGLHVPLPQKGKWQRAGCVVGDGFSVAWRQYDAQFWGVPQRRKRIYLIADFGSERAGEILFEREGVRGYFAQGRTPWEDVAAHSQGSTEADDREVADAGDGSERGPDDVKCYDIGEARLRTPNEYTGKTPTITARCGTGGNNVPAVVYSFDSLASNSMKSKNPNSGCRRVEVAKTLDTTDPNPGKNQGGIAIVESVTIEPVYCLQGNGIDRADTAGCNGKGWTEDTSYTLNTIDRPAVAYAVGNGQLNQISMAEQSNTLDCMHDQQAVLYQDTVGALCARDYKGVGSQYVCEDKLIVSPSVRYIVRRLTPTECARLQGFADRWGDVDKKSDFTDEEYAHWLGVRNVHAVVNGKQAKEYTKEQMIAWYNKLHTDSAEYKMWGNGIALPCAVDVLSRLERN